MTLEEEVALKLMGEGRIVCVDNPATNGFRWEGICPFCGDCRYLIMAERDNLSFICSCGREVKLSRYRKEDGIWPHFNIRKIYEKEGRDWRHMIRHFGTRRP